ncbi:hypothetical protein K449DRAFT_433959 [Hypoxylon sp. EC38]|nr:hypothetical protein K449DRAFT_433959 [Hypoxylon sp. EC38]
MAENVPFLTYDEDIASSSRSSLPKKSSRHIFSSTGALGPFLALLLSNLLWLINYVTAGNTCIRPKLIYSPATSSISYERIELWRSIEPSNVYTGEPREELDEAWRELIKPMAIKISAQELAQLGESSIAFKDGSGVLAQLGVYHELHCIKKLKHWIYLSHYYGNPTIDL